MNKQKMVTINLNGAEVECPVWKEKNGQGTCIEINGWLHENNRAIITLCEIGNAFQQNDYEPLLSWQPEIGKVYRFFDDENGAIMITELRNINYEILSPFSTAECMCYKHVIDITGLNPFLPIAELKKQCGGRWA